MKMPINVPMDVYEKFSAFIDGEGRVKQVLIGKILTWWMRQPEAVRKVASLEVTEGLERAYANALHAIAESVQNPVNPPASTLAVKSNLPPLEPPVRRKPVNQR